MVHVEGATFGRAMLSALFSGVVAAAVAATVVMLTAETAAGRPDLALYTQWLAALVVMTVSVAILRNAFATSFPKAIAVWCAAVGLAALLAVVLMPVWAYLAGFLDRLAPTAV
jgi:hypothetical protein